MKTVKSIGKSDRNPRRRNAEVGQYVLQLGSDMGQGKGTLVNMAPIPRLWKALIQISTDTLDKTNTYQ